MFNNAAVRIIAITLLITLFYLWSRLEVISLGYDIARANKEQAEFVNENKRLKLEILSLKSPQRIEALVSERLGLVYPRGGQLIIVKKKANPRTKDLVGGETSLKGLF